MSTIPEIYAEATIAGAQQFLDDIKARRQLPQIVQDAHEYVDLINGPANAWGSHVHPTLGRSDRMLRTMYDRHGRVEFDGAVTHIFHPDWKGKSA